MQIALLAIISIIPTVVLLWYFDKQDKGQKEPRKLKWKIFAWGVMAAVFAVVIELNIEDFYRYLGINPIETFWLYIFMTAFVTAALVEEAIKLWVVKTHAYNDKNFNEVMDGITYTIIASLGFATFENIFYVMDGGLGIGIMRAVISVPAHALFSGIMGFYIGKSKFAKTQKQATKLIFIGFAYGVFYHGLFDFLLFTQTLLVFLVLPLLIVMGLHLKSKIAQAYFHDHLTKTKPQKLSAWRITKVVIATILILIGTAGVIGTIMLTQDPASGYTGKDIVYAVIFAAILLIISYFLLRKKAR